MGKLFLIPQTLLHVCHILPFSFKLPEGKAVYLYIFAHSILKLEWFIVTSVILDIRRIKIIELYSNTFFFYFIFSWSVLSKY